MTGPTHRQYSICFGYIAAMLFYYLGVSHINYYLALPILIMTARSGALFPDLDHIWRNVSEKTFLNRIINGLIHITGGKHRSWQTHSIDICSIYVALSFILPNELFTRGIISEINKEVLLILMLGFASGWVSHLFSDMLTSEGVRLLCFMKFKVKFVPKKLGKLRFNTGNEWEKFNYKAMRAINIVMGIICVVYPIFKEGYIQIGGK